MKKNRSFIDKLAISWTVFIIIAVFIEMISIIHGHYYAILIYLTLISLSFFTFILVSTKLVNDVWFINLICRCNRELIPVELISYNASSKFSIAKYSKNGELHAAEHWETNIGNCILLPDGTICATSSSTHIYYWMPLNKYDRMAFILTNDLPDFSAIRELPKDEKMMTMYKLKNNL